MNLRSDPGPEAGSPALPRSRRARKPKAAPKPRAKGAGKAPARSQAKARPKAATASRPARKSSRAEPANRRRAAKASSRKEGAGKARRRDGGAPPMSRKMAETLLNLEQILGRRIVGKDEAIARIARVVRVRLAELDFRPDRPKGSFLLVGPTGVGKNELAYALSEALYGTEDRVLALDLGELAEEEDLAKLGVTMVPGTTNQAMEGMLTSPIRRTPEAIILLKGLERAHAAFQPVLLQILERGQMDDMLGTVSFSRATIFVTTRPRREDNPAGEIGFSRTAVPAQELLRRRLERGISEELLDAFNEIIEIPPLSTEAVRQIARYKVEAVLKRLNRNRRNIQVAENVFEAFIPQEEAQRKGVGLLHQTLEDRLFNPLARYLLTHRQSRSIKVEMSEGMLRIHE